MTPSRPPRPRARRQAPAVTALSVTERQFQRQVVELATLTGWMVFHTWLSIHSPAGFPDLFLIRPPRVVLAELKSETGKLTPAQERWIGALAACPGIEVFTWRPGDWPVIEATLK